MLGLKNVVLEHIQIPMFFIELHNQLRKIGIQNRNEIHYCNNNVSIKNKYYRCRFKTMTKVAPIDKNPVFNSG